MASEMLRPAVVTFLDVMLRREDEALRIEELAVPASMVGRKLAALDLQSFRKLLLLAVRTGQSWTYNPRADYVMQAANTLVFMGSPEERVELERSSPSREQGLTPGTAPPVPESEAAGLPFGRASQTPARSVARGSRSRTRPAGSDNEPRFPAETAAVGTPG